MQEPNFKCPKTDKEYFIPKYRSIPKGDDVWVYQDNYGKELLSEDGEKLVLIEKEFDGYPTAVYGDTNTRINNRQKYLKKRANKHAQTLE